MWLPRSSNVACCPTPPDTLRSQPHDRVPRDCRAGDSADELRSLGLYEAPSAREALVRCLAQLDEDPVADHEAALRDPTVVELLRREQQRQLHDSLAEPDVSFIVTPVDAEAHFVRDRDGVARDANEVERRRAQMRRDFGVDVL